MSEEGLVLFVHYFPQQGSAETRVLMVSGHPDLPPDEYALLELYCADPRCNCRRVMLNLVGRQQNGIQPLIQVSDVTHQLVVRALTTILLESSKGYTAHAMSQDGA